MKMQNLSQKELRLIAKNRNINGYKSMLRDKSLRITIIITTTIIIKIIIIATATTIIIITIIREVEKSF